jgi:hypothetical protein
MKQVQNQQLLTLKQASKTIPSRPHVATLWRWVNRGCRGIQLESWLIGGLRYTSVEAIEKFFAQTNSKPAPAKPDRQREIAAAEQALAGK